MVTSDNKKRAVRKHHDKRMFLKRFLQCRSNFCRWSSSDDSYRESTTVLRERAKRMLSTPHPCSCMMCGNPRRHYGNQRIALTMQEIRSSFNFTEQLHDV